IRALDAAESAAVDPAVVAADRLALLEHHAAGRLEAEAILSRVAASASPQRDVSGARLRHDAARPIVLRVHELAVFEQQVSRGRTGNVGQAVTNALEVFPLADVDRSLSTYGVMKL